MLEDRRHVLTRLWAVGNRVELREPSYCYCGSNPSSNDGKDLELIHRDGNWTPATSVPDDAQTATFAAGCFWGVESAFRETEGVLATRVGYTGGDATAPTYEQVCSGRTGHAEAVKVWFAPDLTSYEELVALFWSLHDPTSRNRQGWDIGTQYRSAIFVDDAEQEKLANDSRATRQEVLSRPIVTEIVPASEFYDAEEYHQRYFEKHGGAFCATTVR
jgi:peptide-methionine (S)-S-oxide reductase